ncbi:histone deacetylase 6 isoform X2 [Oryzias latipes]|uniref:histone deacetylase 6 isoform X2 n=1 Tax=Oryzias latipes TaxID=8090 RepID=UPI0009D9864A|nr:histone deacetylase 6 isoform X2 [Oryzias latipes]
MQPGSEPPRSGSKSVRRSPRLSSQDSKDGIEERRRGSNLQEVKRRGRIERSYQKDEELSSIMGALGLSGRSAARGTGLVYSEIFTRHQNLWEPSHPESPDRVRSIMEELERQQLLPCCVSVQPRAATEEELLLVHTKDYIDLVKSTETMTQSELQTLCCKYDSVYLHPLSFKVCAIAAGSVLQLVDEVMAFNLRNGFAVIRPPGHHAQTSEPNGFCVFNNVAIAARYACSRHAVSRVLIVDWDVHHGQGLQYLFQEDPSILYFSIHRYEHASFWPHLPESDSSFVGSGHAIGRNINLPWNKIGMSDADYISAFQHVLLPVAYEFQPQLVLVSAGFDAAAGDPKGEMNGGYNLKATAEGAAACVRALLGRACPPLNPPTGPSESAMHSISQTISALYVHWAFLQVLEGTSSAEADSTKTVSGHTSTTTVAPALAAATITGLVYDERMMEHVNLWDRHHPEQPQRIFKIFSRHQQLGLVDRCQLIQSRLATEEELAMCHSLQHIQQMSATATMKPRDLHRLGDEFVSIFISNQSFQSAQLAAGSCFAAVEHMLNGQVNNAVAIVRPPGHHAEMDFPCGFCLFNTTALTARHAQKVSHDLQILILDWDVHHGNGTQHIFEDDNSVLYISLHRYDNGAFFPSSKDGAPENVGVAKGAGYNVNLAWSGGRMGDSDYLAAFHQVVMPIATEFNPGLVLVSAGFDAAQGDPLGGYHVTPEGYAHFTHMLMSLAGGRVLFILEGGYNLKSISDSMAACTSVLLGDPPPSLATPLPPPHHCAAVAINKVIQHHAPYWKSLRVQIPESVRAFLPSPKHRGKHGPKGRVRKSEQNSMGRLESSIVQSGLEQLMQGLAGLDISQSPANQSLSAVSLSVRSESDPHSDTVEEMRVLKGDSQSRIALPQTVAEVTPEMAIPKDKPQLEGACGWAGCQKDTGLMCAEETSLYVVDPLPWCSHLGSVKPLPPSGIDVSRPCQDCGSEAENWICLTCYQVFCGRYVNEHMVAHGKEVEHPMVLSFSDLSVWCYMCESYIHHQVLFQAKNAAHFSKFGEESPPWK